MNEHGFPRAAHTPMHSVRLLQLRLALAACLPLVCGVAAAAPQPGSMDGTWVNIDPTSRGIPMIEIEKDKLHPYGACQPKWCDWGEIKARGFAPSVEGGLPVALFAESHQGFADVKLAVVLEQSGRLRVEVFTHFTDDSGRADYYSTSFFERGRLPFAP